MVTINDQRPSIYLNGILVRSGIKSFRPVSYAPVLLGDFEAHGFKGDMDEAAIYYGVLPADTIMDKYVAGKAAVQWHMNEGVGAKVNDSTGNNNNGTIAGGATWTEGTKGKALRFDGVDDRVSFSYKTVQPSNNFTLEAWIKPTEIHEIDTQSTTGASGITGQKWVFGANLESGSAAGVGVSVGINGISVYEHAGSYMPALAVYQRNLGTNWSHLVVVIENQTPKIYLNGELVHTGFKSPRSASYSPTNIGYGNYGAFKGCIDEVVIYNSVLSDEEISRKYFSGLAPEIIAQWHMDEGTGSIINDSSSYGNYGTKSAGVEWVDGINGKGLSFDGTNSDYMSYSYTTGKPADNFTLETWVKPTEPHIINPETTTWVYYMGRNQKYVFEPKHEGTTGAGGIGLSVGTNGISVYEHAHDYLPAIAVYEGIVGTDWAHIVVVIEEQRPTIYLNGYPVRIGLKSPKTESYAPIRIGSSDLGYGAFQGLIDEVVIYEKALSASDVWQRYNLSPTIDIFNLPVDMGIHKAENTLAFSVIAYDSDLKDEYLTTEFYLDIGSGFKKINNFTANGTNITNGQLSAASGALHNIVINKTSSLIPSSVNSFKIKVVTRDQNNLVDERVVTFAHYNTVPSIDIGGLTENQRIPSHEDLFFSITARDFDEIDQSLKVELYFVTSTDGEEIGNNNRKEVRINSFTANSKNNNDGILIANSNTNYNIVIDKSLIPTTGVNFKLKAIVQDSLFTQDEDEITLICANQKPIVEILNINNGQSIRKSNNTLDFAIKVTDGDLEDVNLETEFYIGLFNYYHKITEFTVNGILNTEEKFLAEDGTEYIITLNKGVLVPMYVNDFKIKVVAKDNRGGEGEREISLVHYTDVLAQWSLDSIKERIAVDSGGQSNNGVIHGATLTTGIISNALEFDGVDDYVEVPLSSALTITTGSFSIEAWVKTSDAPLANDGIVCNFNTRTGSTPFWILGIYGDTEEDRGKYYFQIYDENAVNAIIKSDIPLNNGQWHHLVGVRDAVQGKVRFYVDGILVSEENAPSGDINSAQSLFIGNTLNRYFQGCIDEVTLYGCALTAEEVEQNYQNVIFLDDIKITNAHNEDTKHSITFGSHINKIEFDLNKTVNELKINLDLPSSINVGSVVKILRNEEKIEDPIATIVDGDKIIVKQALTPGRYRIEFILTIDEKLIIKTQSYSDEKDIETNYECEDFEFSFMDFDSLPNLL